MSLLIEVAAPNNQNLQVTTSDEISDKLANAGVKQKRTGVYPDVASKFHETA